MRKSILNTAMASSLVLFSVQAGAASLISIDPRSFAMGGVGVASGTSANAGFVNPALLAAAQDKEDFSVEFPIIYGRLADPDDLVEAVDDIAEDDLVSEFDQALDAFNAAPLVNRVSGPEKTALINATRDLIGALESVSDKALLGEGGAAFVVGIPSKEWGVSVQAAGWVVGGGFAKFTDEDAVFFNGVVDQLEANDPAIILNPVDTDTMNSYVEGRLGAIMEFGVSFAREFNVAGENVAFGVTPKYVEVATYDYQFVGNELDSADINVDEGEKTYSDFNVDFGVAKDFENGWKGGLVVKNLISQEYETVRGNKIEIAPQARAGISHQNEWVAVAFDADLNAADPVGFESETQYIGLGAELDIFDTAQLRLGYRHNLKDSDTSVPTVGIGLSPFGVHIDLALAANDDEVAFSGQLGFRF